MMSCTLFQLFRNCFSTIDSRAFKTSLFLSSCVSVGRLYNGNTVGQQFGPKCCRGDRIGCGISLDSDDGQLTVFFTKNGKEVSFNPRRIYFPSESIACPPPQHCWISACVHRSAAWTCQRLLTACTQLWGCTPWGRRCCWTWTLSGVPRRTTGWWSWTVMKSTGVDSMTSRWPARWVHQELFYTGLCRWEGEAEDEFNKCLFCILLICILLSWCFKNRCKSVKVVNGCFIKTKIKSLNFLFHLDIQRCHRD